LRRDHAILGRNFFRTEDLQKNLELWHFYKNLLQDFLKSPVSDDFDTKNTTCSGYLQKGK